MNHRSRARTGSLPLAVCVTVLLTSCGGGGGSSAWDGTGAEGGGAALKPNGAVLVGIAGVTWSAQNTTVDKNGNPIAETTTGVTDDAGAFEVASTTTCTTATDPATGKGTTTCQSSGFQTPTLAVGGSPLPPLAAPINGYSQARYALLDFGAASFNVASFFLMGNSATGDPLINGISLSSGFSTKDCPTLDWSTTNIQQDAACFLTQANKDGMLHSWPTADTVNKFLQGQWLRVHAGMYNGHHANTATAAYPAGNLSGTSAAIVSIDGTAEGWLDYSSSAQPNNLPGVDWSGTLVVTSAAPGGALTYTTGSTAPVPDMTVNFIVGVNGADVSYQTADGSLAGTTMRYDSNGVLMGPGMGGPGGQPAITFPKYHFQVKNLPYTRPGQSRPDAYVFSLEIGYGSYAEGGLTPWHPLPLGTDPPMWLQMYGQLNKDNTVTLHWFPDTITKIPPASNSTMTLKFDPTTLTLSGDLIGYDGSAWTSVTIQGWRT